jgi:hypothetical protein
VAAALQFATRLDVRTRIHTGSGAFPFPRAAPRHLVRLGYCRTAEGSLVVFSIMMNRVNDVLEARRL